MSGVMFNVALLSVGEARGHGVMITQRTLASALVAAATTPVAAFITHDGASGDRMLGQIGYFSHFFIDGDSLRAHTFTALPSFKDDEAMRYRRLFDIAAAIPDNVGISLVFTGELVWETLSAGFSPANLKTPRPPDAAYAFPTVIISKIMSADFVESPAATTGLFSSEVDATFYIEKEVMNMDAPETHIESAPIAETPAGLSVAKVEPPEAPALTATLQSKLEAHAALQLKLEARVVELELRLTDAVAALSTAPIIHATGVLKSKEEVKREAIAAYVLANPADSRMTAILSLAKTNPELF